MQVIFSGYDGPKRKEINNDKDLNIFYQTFGIIVQAEVDQGTRTKYENAEHEEKHRKLEEKSVKNFNMTSTELKKLRLGGCVTKIQMRKFLRHLGDRMKENVQTKMDLHITKEKQELLVIDHEALNVEHDILNTKYNELEESVPGQIEMACTKAVFNAHKEWKIQKEAEIKKIDAQHNLEIEKQKNELKKTMRNEVEKVHQQRKKEVAEVVAERDAVQQKLIVAEEEIENKQKELERFAGLGDAEIERQKRMDELEARFASCKKQLEECINLLEEHDIPVPGKIRRQESTLFKWRLARISDKFTNYTKDHSIQSPEFTLWGIKGLQAEFFPAGIQNTHPGWSALKFRIPRLEAVQGKTHRVSLKWKVLLEDGTCLGQRRDEFCDNYWWCRKGMVVWPNFAKQEVLQQHVSAKDYLDLTLEIIEATSQMVDADNPDPPRRGANTVAAIKDLQEAAKVRPGQELLISFKGRILDDRTLIDFVMDYLAGVRSIVQVQKNIGSVMWDTIGSPVGRLRPGMAATLGGMATPSNRKSSKNAKNKGMNQTQPKGFPNINNGLNDDELRDPRPQTHCLRFDKPSPLNFKNDICSPLNKTNRGFGDNNTGSRPRLRDTSPNGLLKEELSLVSFS